MTLRETFDNVQSGLDIARSALNKACIDAFDIHSRNIWLILETARTAILDATDALKEERKKELGDETQG